MNGNDNGRRLTFEIFRFNPADPASQPTMERFEMQEVSEDGRLYKESYRDTQLGLAGVGNQAEAGGHSAMTETRR